MRQFFQDVSLNTDDRPILEYEAPKNLWNPGNLPNLYFEIAGIWTDSFDELEQMLVPEVDSLVLAKLRQKYFSQRIKNLELIARFLGKWCLQLEQQGRLHAALDQYRRMFTLFPETLNPFLLEAFIGMSVVYEKLGNRSKAEELYRAAITMAPTEIESRNVAGWAFAVRELYSRAEDEWRRVLQIDPDDEEAKNGLQWLSSRR